MLRMRMTLAMVGDFFYELGWCVYAILFRPLTPGSWFKALRELDMGYEICLAVFIVVGAMFELAALSVILYLMFFRDWGLSIAIAFIIMAVLYGIFYWQDKRQFRAERRYIEKHTAPPAPS